MRVDPWRVLELLERDDPTAVALLAKAFPAGAATPEPASLEDRLALRLHLVVSGGTVDGGDRSGDEGARQDTMAVPDRVGARGSAQRREMEAEREGSERQAVERETAAERETDLLRAVRTLDAALGAARALRSGRTDELVVLAREAASMAPASMPWIRFHTAALLQSCFRFTGDLVLHRMALEACAPIADDIGSPHLAVQARALLGSIHLLRGTYHTAIDRCDAAIALADAAGIADHAAAAMAHQFRGYVLFEWNRLDEAESALQRAWQLAGDRKKGVRSGVARIMARVMEARGAGDEVERWLESLHEIAGEPATLRNREWLAAVRIRHRARTGSRHQLEEWLRTYDYRPVTVVALEPLEVASRLHELDHALTLLEATKRWAELRAIASTVAAVTAERRAWFAARALAAAAVALEAMGSSDAADRTWAEALQAGEVGSFVRVYTDGSPLRERLLDRAARRSSDPGEAGRVREAARVREATRVREAAGWCDLRILEAGALTPRQTAVLRRVERGASNKAIARELGLSVSTVKTHLREVFSRLDASSRTEAVARARDRGWL